MKVLVICFLAGVLLSMGCENLQGPIKKQSITDTTNSNNTTAVLTIQPKTVRIETNGQQKFYSALNGVQNKAVVYNIEPTVGSIDSNRMYSAPTSISTDSVTVLVIVSLVEKPSLRDTAVLTLVRTSVQELCFSRDVLPIFTSNCTMCHNQNPLPGEDDVVDLRTYSDIMGYVKAGDLDGSKIYRMITRPRPNKDAMPQDKPLQSDQIELIRKWILSGAENKDCSGTGLPCDTLSVTYTKTIAPLLQTQCLGCHATSVFLQYGGGVSLEGYDNVRKQGANTKLSGAISHAPGFRPMPQGGAKLPDCSISQVKAWIHKGMPQ